MTFAQVTQVAVFVIFCLQFLAFSFGIIHVPTVAEDQKFFYMIFGILNTILSVQALSYKVQKDDGYIAPVVQPEAAPTKEITNEEVADTNAVA